MPSGKKKGKQAATPATQAGVFIFPSGEKYDGEYVEQSPGQIERNGTGTHHSADGTVYTGQWANDKMNGKGEMKHPSGATYKGDFVDNEYHGTGTYTLPDGSSYTGAFVHNRMEGKGKFTDSSRRVWTGVFSGKMATGLRLQLS